MFVQMPVMLYAKQREILDFIAQFMAQNGFAPTLKEVAEALDVSSPTINQHIHVLVEKGVLRRQEGVNRSLEIVEENILQPSPKGISLPILGYIAAGTPLEPYTDPQASFPVSPVMVKLKKPHYILQVKGNSLIEEGILEGDYVVVAHQETAEDGEIVVAILPSGLATLKRYFKEKDRVRLEPANSQMKPIFTPEVRIQGKVVGIIRRYG